MENSSKLKAAFIDILLNLIYKNHKPSNFFPADRMFSVDCHFVISPKLGN